MCFCFGPSRLEDVVLHGSLLQAAGQVKKHLSGMELEETHVHSARLTLCLLRRIKIQDDNRMGKDDMAAWACIRLDRLQSGYRFVHLLDWKGMESAGVLLVKITKSWLHKSSP